MAKVIETVNKSGLNSLYLDTEKEELFRTAINNHNKDLYRKGHKALENATKNFMLTQMFNIIESPVNQLEAQTPIDNATSIVKNVANNKNNPVVIESKTASNRNAITNMKGIINTQVGKKGVGISAVGLKSFFAITNYVDSVLSNPNSTSEQLQRLRLGYKGNGITVGGKTYYTFANAYKFNDDQYKEPLNAQQQQELYRTIDTQISQYKNTNDLIQKQAIEKQINSNLIHLLTSCDNDTDAAIVLSALLSQATDNAKELTLGKINAGTNILGMYIYGISIGMHFNDVANILMSKSARIIASMMEGNIFEGSKGMSIEDIFDYFELGPDRQINQYVSKDFNEENQDNDIKSNTPRRDALNIILRYFENSSDQDGLRIDDYNTTLGDFIAVVTRNNKDIRARLMEMFDDIKSINNNVYVNQIVDFCQDFLIKQTTVIGDDPQLYKDIKTLSAGAEEFKVLGQLLHVNQGLETSMSKQISYLSKFDLSTNRQLKINKEINRKNRLDPVNKENEWDVAEKLTIDDFIQNPKKCIDNYEKVKHTFNLFDILYNSQHFYQYAKSAWILDAKLNEISAKYRAIKYWSEVMASELGVPAGSDSTIRGLIRMTNDYIISDWLLSPRFGGNKDKPLSIYLSKEEKQKILDNGMTFQEEVKKGGYINLIGSYEGKAQYKKWFEQIVIPNLQQGYNGKIDAKHNLVINYALKNNKFIQALTPNVFTNTPTHTNVIAYTLPINMSPRSDEEINAFQEYKMAFNELNSESFGYYRTPNGDVYRLQDLFFIYNLITHYNQVGEKTLTNIFTDAQDYGLISDFYKYEGEFDQNYDITPEVVSDEYVRKFVIPVGSVWGTTAKMIWMSTGDSFDPVLYEKLTDSMREEYADNETEPIKRNYKGEEYIRSDSSRYYIPEDSDYVGFSYSNSPKTVHIDIDGKDYTVNITDNNGHIQKIEYKLPNSEVKTINFENQEFKLNLQFTLQIGEDGKKQVLSTINLSNIKQFIENDINKC